MAESQESSKSEEKAAEDASPGATMRMPAPEFPNAYRTPKDFLSDAAGEAPAPSGDVNARTMVLPAPDFGALRAEAARIDEANSDLGATMKVPVSEMPLRVPPQDDNPWAYMKDEPALPKTTPLQPWPENPPEAGERKSWGAGEQSNSPPAPPVLDAPVQAIASSAAASEEPVQTIAPPVAPAEPSAPVIQAYAPPVPDSPFTPTSAPEQPVVSPSTTEAAYEPAAAVSPPPPAPVSIPPLASPGVSAAGFASPGETSVLAPPPDNPFGGSNDSSAAFEAGFSRSSWRAPAPSGLNWRTVMNQIPTEKPKPVLKAEGLVKWFGKREVVRGVDLEVGAGEIIGLLGRNGAGKTTTFRMIMGLLHPDKGQVIYENRNVTRLPMFKRANMGIGYLAQNPSIFQRLSVEENLMAVLELQEPNRKLRNAKMDKLIQDLGLEKVRKQQSAVLSGGERRRLEIARAMSLNPRIVLFDEPFAGIDPITVNEIQAILRDLKKQGVGVLVTDHNVRETLTITDRTYIMDEGKIWIHGHPREIVENEQARARYLGHEFRLDF